MKRFIESTKSRTDNLRRSVSRCFLLCLLITAFFLGGCMFRPLLEKRKTETVPSVRTQDLTRPSVRTAPSKVPRSTEPSAKTAPSRLPRLTESTTKASEVSEATKRSKPVDLYAVWENHLRSVQEIEMVFLKEDFDGDGVAEAFGITGKPYMNYCRQYAGENVKIYFISAAGEVSLVRDQTDWGEPIYGYLNTGDLLELAESPGRLTYEAGSSKFFTWELDAGGSGSASIVMGVKNGKPYEPAVSGQYGVFLPTDDGRFCAVKHDFSAGYHEYIQTYFVFDERTKEFIEE